MEKMQKDFSLDEVLRGKATSIKGKDYLPTEGYITPFLERVSKLTSDIRVHVKLPDQLTYDKNGDIDSANLTFNRVWIEAVLPEEFQFENHQEVIGMVYGLDVRKPIFKTYKGALNSACTNLCIFNPQALDIQEITPDKPINYRVIDTLMEQTTEIGVRLKKFQDTEFDYTNIEYVEKQVGHWSIQCMEQSRDFGYGKVKLASSVATDAYKLLFTKKDSPYLLNDKNANMFTVYNAFTQLITDAMKKDIMNQVEKTLLVTDILNI